MSFARSFTNIDKLFSAKALVAGSTNYTAGRKFEAAKGYTSLLIVTTGSITVTAQYSNDDVTYYDAYDTSGNAIGQIMTGSTLGYYMMNPNGPVVAEYVRFKVVDGGGGETVSLTFNSKE